MAAEVAIDVAAATIAVAAAVAVRATYAACDLRYQAGSSGTHLHPLNDAMLWQRCESQHVVGWRGGLSDYVAHEKVCHIYVYIHNMRVCIVYMLYVCICVYVYVCVYTYIYIYIYIHTY